MRRNFKNIEIYLVMILLCGVVLSCCTSPDSRKIDITITKIWDKVPHNAYTDLIKFNGTYYCSYSEEFSSSGYTTEASGSIGIIRSKTGKKWERVALIQKEGINLCNPRLSITPDRQIMIIMDGAVYSLVSFSNKKGDVFSDPEIVNIDTTIISGQKLLWKVTWFRGTGYALLYKSDSKNDKLSLLKTIDGKNFEKITKIEVDGLLNESTLRFDQKGTMYALISQDDVAKNGTLGMSDWPYIDWSYTKINNIPNRFNFTIVNKSIVVVAPGLSMPELHTGILVINKNRALEEIIKLPLGKDACFPGILTEQANFLVSCCSAHEGKSAIYMVKVPIKIIKQKMKN